MSKINVGDRVRIKSSGVVGTVMGREQKALENKKVLVEYVVKTGNGFDSYKPFTRKEIEKIVTETRMGDRTYPRIYNYEHQCADGRTIVVTGVVDTYRKYDPFDLRSVKMKTLSVGYAICHPHDENDKNIGADIALRRANSKPLAYFETPFVGEFREDFVSVILQSKAAFIEENIERFINRDK
jgi:hypothetical protein